MEYYYTQYWIVKLVILSIFTVFVVIFYTSWNVEVCRHLIRSLRLYKVYKTKDFRDTRDQYRILYNYETHIVKDVILLVLSCVEIAEVLIGFTTSIVPILQLHSTTNITQSEQDTVPNQCNLQNILQIGSSDGLLWTKIEISIVTNCSVGFILLLSFLCIYMYKRYYQQAYYASGLKYFILFLSQLVLLSILSNRDVALLYLLTIPVVLLFDWCVLVRNSRRLYRALKSNVRDLNLNLSHRHLYKQQLRLLQIYAKCMPILLAGVLFGVSALSFYAYMFVFGVIIRLPCILNGFFTENISTPALLFDIREFGFLTLAFIHFVLMGSPLYIISIHNLISRCKKRLCTQESHLRFNYTNFSELRRYNLTPPY